ncbi:flagellar hook-associated protein FlgK [Aliiglaciecola lipolytica]|uniref:Flagellar hook-associated protein 1 n=1 Tax=Aliiglaciecola lipolytica E3 TaxID=1127673 RepID=K6YEX0_9ALTE|nr:flagellar hook-associated protein FlgK [Aliiglaciecola lipolytica]GAC15183.1 flagellar hook-associated protein 1 FlgK [Aliiglaciecola lipolytica E3]
MIKAADLYTIATSGVRASNQLLATTSNNIANVNSEGYVRERTTFDSQLVGGVGRGVTERVINTFAQNQLRRDTTQVGEFETYFQRSSVLDNIFASEANSLSSSMSRFFSSMQTASDEPTNMAARQLVLGEANALVGQVSTLSKFMDDKEKELNYELDATINEANKLIETIAELNANIRVAEGNNLFDEPGVLKNERDNAILKLAEIMSIETRDNGRDDGSVMVNLTSGESLVLEDGSFNLFQLSGDPDPDYRNLYLASTGKPTTLRLPEQNLGGQIGGLFRYRDEVLAEGQRELGQIAIALTSAVNQQNRLGMDFDQQLGGNIFSNPEFQGLNYAANSDLSLTMNGRVAEDGASNITAADYLVEITGTNSGTPDTVDITVTLVNPDGSFVTDVDGNAITQAYTGLDAENNTFTEVIGGLELEFPNGDSYAVGDQFLFQPTKSTGQSIDVIMTRPEDIALASPFRVDSNLDNLGDARLTDSSMSNTFVDATLTDPRASAFDGNGGFVAGSPARIVFNSETEFEVFDEANNSLVVVSNISDYNNLMQQAANDAGWPFNALPDFPGYDFSLQGTPVAGDEFTIAYNTDGVDDNRNGLELAGLQDQDIMQQNNNGGGNLVTFHESYANIVSSIGAKTASANISLQAAEAMKTQSSDWFQSVSGVNLDEEAANLIRFQQSYAASARILTTARELFDTIYSVTR